MGILVETNGTWMDSRAEEIDRRLRDGDPVLGWRGDVRLELRLGRVTDRLGNVRTDPRTGLRMERYEVWRHCGDVGVKQHERFGQWRRIGKWEMHEADRIIRDLVGMDPRTRGAKTPLQKIDEMEKADDADQDRAFTEALGPIIEHQLALERDKEHRHFYGQQGMGEGKMTRQRRRAEQRARDKAGV